MGRWVDLLDLFHCAFLVGVFVGAMRATFFFICFVIYTFIFTFSIIILFSFFLARKLQIKVGAGELGVSGCCFSVFSLFDRVFLVMGVHKFKCWLSYILLAILK